MTRRDSGDAGLTGVVSIVEQATGDVVDLRRAVRTGALPEHLARWRVESPAEGDLRVGVVDARSGSVHWLIGADAEPAATAVEVEALRGQVAGLAARVAALEAPS